MYVCTKWLSFKDREVLWVLLHSIYTKALLPFWGGETILGFSPGKTTGVCVPQQTFLGAYTSICRGNHEKSYYHGATNLSINISTNFTFPEVGTAIYCVQHLTQCSLDLVRVPLPPCSEMVNKTAITMFSPFPLHGVIAGVFLFSWSN